MKKRIVVGADHGAVALKKRIVDFLIAEGHEVKDMGVHTEDSVDYPDLAEVTCNEYRKGGYDFGILFCGTGIGISISANKMEGIRCALLCNLFSAEMAKAHNNANFIAFGGRIDYADSVEEMVKRFMETEALGDRHQRRVDKIMSLQGK